MKSGLYLILVTILLGLPQWGISQEKPNIILFLADDLGYGDIGVYGCKDIRTPNIDRLAAEGAKFTSFYANGSLCSPTRTALLSGRYQHRVGGMESAIGAGNVGRYDEAAWLVERKELGLPPDMSTLPRELKKAGYNTAIVGKWHLGYEEKFRPHNHFFDYSFGPIGIGAEHFYHVEQGKVHIEDSANFTGFHTLAKNGKEEFREGYYSTHLFTDEAKTWLNKQDKNTPFFLYVPYSVPHSPYQGPNDYADTPFNRQEWETRNRTRETYSNMVEEMDKGIGEILAVLERKNLDENTIVVFFSDNGGTKTANNGIYRGNKGLVYEGGIRVPCVVKWPEMIAHHTESEQVTISFDITLSLLHYAGVNVADLKLDGYNMLAHVIEYKPDFNRTLFWRKKRGSQVLKAVRDGNMKMVIEYQNGVQISKELFNLADDPTESNNLLKTHKALVESLDKKLAQWEVEVRAERLAGFTPKPPKTTANNKTNNRLAVEE